MTRHRPGIEYLENRTLPSTAQYVASLYADLLQRGPTQAESTATVNFLNTGSQPLNVALGLATSTEFFNLQTTHAYQNILGRLPSVGDLQYWAAAQAAGLSEQQETADILASNEFFTREGNVPLNWLMGAYVTVLHRIPDPAGQAAFLALNLQDPTVRVEAATSIANSLEADSVTASQAYLVLLHRNADVAGVAYWAGHLNADLSISQMLAAIASSPEYIATRAFGLDRPLG